MIEVVITRKKKLKESLIKPKHDQVNQDKCRSLKSSILKIPTSYEQLSQRARERKHSYNAK